MDFNFKSFQELLSKELSDVYKNYKHNINAISVYTDTGAMTVCIAINTQEHLEQRQEEDPNDKCYYEWTPDEWKHDYVESDVLNKLSKMLYDTVLELEDNHFDLFQKQLTCN